MDYRYPPGAVRRLDDALLAGVRRALRRAARQRHRRELLAARLERLRGSPRYQRLDNLVRHSVSSWRHGRSQVVCPGSCPAAGRAWASPWAMYAALRDHDPVHHVVPDGRPHEDYYVLSRHDGRAARGGGHRDVLQRAGADGRVRRAREDRPGRQPADGDARPAGAHRVPQAGLARLHAAGGARGRARGPRVRRGASSTAFVAAGGGDIVGGAVQAAAQHGGGPLPRGPGRGPRPVRRLDRRDRRRELRRAPDRGRRRDHGDARLLLRADRAPPPGARSRSGE